jgi:hypothetical protein
MTRETASKALGILFEDKLVAQKRHLFVLLNVEKLKAELL